MTADMLRNKKRNEVVTKLFTGRKLSIFLVFIMQPYYFAVPKNIRLNSMHYFIMKIQQIAFNDS